MNKKNLLLSIILTILVIIFVVGLNNLKYKNSSNKYISTALVNPKYKSEISKITFNDFNLIKKANLWKVEINNNYYPADNKKINDLILNLTKVIKLYKKKDSKKRKINSNYNNSLLFYTSSEDFQYKEISSIGFGLTDFTNTKIEVINLKNNEVYQTENIYTEFLNKDYTYFIRKEFFSEEITNNYDTVQEIKIENFITNKTNYYTKTTNNNDFFYKKLNQILLLRSEDLQLNLYENLTQEKPITQVNLELGNNTSASFSVYFFKNEYYVKTQENLIFKISQWTMNRIVE
ncbi:MAG: hypothetical protein IJ361_06650 [Spirochaetaceae bacterium]|nr:hypothetical protein [Spirochaetaceae bacterium]